MADERIQVMVHVDAGPEADSEDQARVIQLLQQELGTLDLDAVERVRSGVAPAGAKGDPVTLTSLAVTLAPVALKALADLLQWWLSRHERASITLESGGNRITLTGTPSAEQLRILEAWTKRRKG